MAMLNNQRVYTSTSRIRHGFGMGIIWGWVVSKPVIAIAAMPWWDEHHPPTLHPATSFEVARSISLPHWIFWPQKKHSCSMNCGLTIT